MLSHRLRRWPDIGQTLAKWVWVSTKLKEIPSFTVTPLLPLAPVALLKGSYSCYDMMLWRHSVKTRLYKTPSPYFILWNAVTSLGENKII